MRTLWRWLLASMMVMVATPAFSAELVHTYRCEQEDEVSEEDVVAHVQEWLAAARKTKGGEKLQARVLFPVAANAPGDTDFLIEVSAPSFAQWGTFWDNYHDSPVSAVEEKMHLKMSCTDSAVWEVENIAVKPQ